jgi:hypothetical protein
MHSHFGCPGYHFTLLLKRVKIDITFPNSVLTTHVKSHQKDCLLGQDFQKTI